MRMLFRITLAILLVAILSLIGWLAYHSRERLYEGKPARYWVAQISAPSDSLFPYVPTALPALHLNTSLTLSPPIFTPPARPVQNPASFYSERSAAEAVHALGPDTVPVLLTALHDSDDQISANAAFALAQLAPLNPRIFNTLVQQSMRTREPFFHRIYRGALNYSPDKLRESLPKPNIPQPFAKRNYDYWYRNAYRSANVLCTVLFKGATNASQSVGAQVSDPFAQALPTLINGLRDGDDKTAFIACLILNRMGARAATAVPTLIRESQNTNRDPMLRDSVDGTIGNIPASHETVQALMTTSQNKDRLLQCAVIAALGKGGHDAMESAPLLEKFYQGDDQLLRCLAYEALMQIDPQKMKNAIRPDPPPPPVQKESSPGHFYVIQLSYPAYDDYSLYLRFRQERHYKLPSELQLPQIPRDVW